MVYLYLLGNKLNEKAQFPFEWEDSIKKKIESYLHSYPHIFNTCRLSDEFGSGQPGEFRLEFKTVTIECPLSMYHWCLYGGINTEYFNNIFSNNNMLYESQSTSTSTPEKDSHLPHIHIINHIINENIINRKYPCLPHLLHLLYFGYRYNRYRYDTKGIEQYYPDRPRTPSYLFVPLILYHSCISILPSRIA